MAKERIKIKKPKFFLKVKKKIITPVSPNKDRKKFIGVIFIVIGLCIFLGTLLFGYFFPSLLSNNFLSNLFIEREEFVPHRILIPNLGLNMIIENNALKKIEILPTLDITNFKTNQELIVFSNKKYQIFKITNLKIEKSDIQQSFLFTGKTVRIVFPLESKISEKIMIEAEKVSEN